MMCYHAWIHYFYMLLDSQRADTAAENTCFFGNSLSNFSRVSGNAAYVLGTVAEDCNGRERLASLVTGSCGECVRILPDFVRLFSMEDNEMVMNAVGALGTLVRL